MPRRTDAAPATRVSTLELFFDLVFVFTITQLTTVLVHEPTWRGVARSVLVLGVVWWMYGGYAWLTNAVPPRTTPVRLLLVLGMAGFLVVALAIPEAFDRNGVAFGLGYLLVVCVHAGLFVALTPSATARAILAIAPVNLLCAAVLLAAGFVEGGADWVLWGSAFALLWLVPLLRTLGGFALDPGHFVERHGLVVLIVLGESVVAIGVGAGGRPVDLPLVVAAVLGLALVAALWWVYFAQDDERAEQALRAADPDRRSRMSLRGFGYAFLPVLGGVVALAAGVKVALGHLGEPTPAAGAWYLAGGVAAYVGGEAALRLVLGLRPVVLRLGAAALALATAAVGLAVGAEWQMAVLLAVLVGLLAVESRRPA